MRSVKMSIDGNFWDSQIYSGELLLLDIEGASHKIDWHQAVDSIAQKNSDIQTALRVAFSDSDLFYNPKVRKILRDPHLENPIKQQLGKLGELEISVSHKQWRSYWLKRQSPFDFLPADTDIYYNHYFAAGDEGLFSVPRSWSSGKILHSSNLAKQHHDARIFQIKASDKYTALAAAAGDDGLLEFGFRRQEEDILDKEKRLAHRACNACDWAFQSVMGWAAGDGFLASFREENNPQTRKISRVFDRVVNSDELFPDLDFYNRGERMIWGCREKVYRLTEGKLEVSKYSPQTKTKKSQPDGVLFSRAGEMNLDFDVSSVVSTGTAPFGTVLELDDRLIVLRSDEKVDVFPGEPVHWRVFPRSEHYSNQLHIIYEDSMLIVSFVHDYFVNQEEKLAGFARGSDSSL